MQRVDTTATRIKKKHSSKPSQYELHRPTWVFKHELKPFFGCISHCFAELLSNWDRQGYITQLHTWDHFLHSGSWAASGSLGGRGNLIQVETPWLWRKWWCFRKGCSSLIFLIIQVIEVKIPGTSRCDDTLPMRPTHDKVLKTKWMLVIDSAWILVYVRCMYTIECWYDIYNIQMDIDYIYARKLFAQICVENSKGLLPIGEFQTFRDAKTLLETTMLKPDGHLLVPAQVVHLNGWNWRWDFFPDSGDSWLYTQPM